MSADIDKKDEELCKNLLPATVSVEAHDGGHRHNMVFAAAVRSLKMIRQLRTLGAKMEMLAHAKHEIDGL